MDPTGQSLLKLLFNEGESICPANSKYGYHSIPLEKALDGKITLISENSESPIRFCDSSELILVSINPINGFRKDSNVTAFRSFLIELDVGSIKDQLGTINHFKMPFSAQIFSGGKSAHTVITLSEDLKDLQTYRYIASWIFNIVTMADKNCANPSRGCRIPGAYREPGKKQRLICLKERVPIKELLAWLKQYDHLRPKIKEKKIIPEGQADFSRLSPWVRGMMVTGFVFKSGRSNGWYAVGYDFAKAGYSEEKTIEILEPRFNSESDFKEKEWLSNIRSAFKKVKEIT